MNYNSPDSISYKLREYPMAAIAIALITGILIGYHIHISTVITGIICIVCVIAMLLMHKRKIFTVFAAVFFISTGCFLISLKTEQQNIQFSDENGAYQLLLTDYPTLKQNSVKAECLFIDSTGREHKIMFSTARDSISEQLIMGDLIAVYGKLAMPRSLNPESFDYGRYLKSQGYSASIYAVSWKLLRHEDTLNGIKTWGHRRQKQVVEYYQQCGFRPRELGVISALTIGERDLLDDETRTAFSKAGAIHVLAVSGLHVGIIYLILITIFTLGGKFKPMREEWWLAAAQSTAIITTLWIYAIITGLSPSVVRASLMFSLGEIGRNLHRTGFGLNIVGTSAAISLIVNPLALFSISFQLSYSAVIAIMTIGQKFDNWATSKITFFLTDNKLSRISKKVLRYIIGIFTISVAAQIGTIPLTLYYFNQFSLWFWLTNLIILPFAQFIAFYVLILLPIFPAIPRIVYTLMCDYIYWVESLPYSTISAWINIIQAALIYCIIISAYKPRLRYWASVFTLLLIGSIAYNSYTNNHRQEMIIYADRKADIIQFINGRHQTIITQDSTRADYMTKNIALKYNLHRPIIDTTTRAVYTDKTGKMIIITDSIMQGKRTTHPIECDMLILGDIGHVGAKRLLNNFSPQKIILLGTMKTWKRQQFVNICKETDIPCVDIMQEGAIIYKNE